MRMGPRRGEEGNRGNGGAPLGANGGDIGCVRAKKETGKKTRAGPSDSHPTAARGGEKREREEGWEQLDLHPTIMSGAGEIRNGRCGWPSDFNPTVGTSRAVRERDGCGRAEMTGWAGAGEGNGPRRLRPKGGFGFKLVLGF